MANSPSGMLALFGVGLAAAALILSAAGPVAAENCGCQSNECCSKYGYCGTDAEYCGQGCQSGPCTVSGGTGVPVDSIVTDAFFDRIKSKADECVGQNFYTRQYFLDAASENPDFGKGSSDDDSKREIFIS